MEPSKTSKGNGNGKAPANIATIEAASAASGDLDTPATAKGEQHERRSARASAPPTPTPTGVAMWSPNGNLPNKDTHIGLTSGHTIVIPHDRAGVVVEKRFRKAAIAAGCIPVGMDADEDEATTFDRPAKIMAEMRAMLNSSDDGAFDSTGKPNLAMLSHRCGFPVDRSERNLLWAKVEADPDGDGDE